jgi:hypothetical protein
MEYDAALRLASHVSAGDVITPAAPFAIEEFTGTPGQGSAVVNDQVGDEELPFTLLAVTLQ